MKKENKIKQLEKRIKELEETKKPRPFLWKEFLGLIIFAGLTIANFFLIISTWDLLGLGDLSESNITGFKQLLICYPLIFEYVFVCLFVICLTALIKGGFSNLKKINEVGLIAGLISGLMGGLIVGLIVGLISGLIGGLMLGLIVGLMLGLMGGLEGELK